MLSTYHKGSDFVSVERNTKVNGEHVVLQIRQPKAIHDYNHGMGELTCLTAGALHTKSGGSLGSIGRLSSMTFWRFHVSTRT